MSTTVADEPKYVIRQKPDNTYELCRVQDDGGLAPLPPPDEAKLAAHTALKAAREKLRPAIATLATFTVDKCAGRILGGASVTIRVHTVIDEYDRTPKIDATVRAELIDKMVELLLPE